MVFGIFGLVDKQLRKRETVRRDLQMGFLAQKMVNLTVQTHGIQLGSLREIHLQPSRVDFTTIVLFHKCLEE